MKRKPDVGSQRKRGGWGGGWWLRRKLLGKLTVNFGKKFCYKHCEKIAESAGCNKDGLRM